MDQDERRIRTLKLSGCDHTLLLKARYRLEEAFRIASLPGVPPNAQLLIRRFNLGTIPFDQSSVLLADRISEMLQSLTAAASCVDYHSAADADAVWFSDPLQAYKVLLVRLLEGNVPHEWYWRTMFPDQTLVLNSDAIETIFSQAAAGQLKGLAVARLLQAALAPHRLIRLFPFIAKDMVRHLLHEQGLVTGYLSRTAEQHADPLQAVRTPDMSLPWRYAVWRAVECWGDRDLRTLWFAWCGLICHSPAWLGRKGILQRIVPSAWLESWALPEITGPAVDAMDEGVIENNAGVASGTPEVGPVEPKGFEKLPFPAASFPLKLEETVDPDSEFLIKGIDPVVAYPSLKITDDDLKAPASSCPVVEAEQQKKDVSQVEIWQDGDRVQGGDVVPGVAAPWSAHAGMAFFIPLLQRLGMAELLKGNEGLVELDLPRQLLWSLSQRFGVAESDPFMALFENFKPSDDVTINQFSCPGSWRKSVTSSGRPLKAIEHSGTTEQIQFSEVIRIMQLLAGLYLRRCCNLSPRSLIKRSGRVVMTATHWDVIFNINQIDIRLRRVGLDCDPGWVVWLGRVVQFHYNSDGDAYVS